MDLKTAKQRFIKEHTYFTLPDINASCWQWNTLEIAEPRDSKYKDIILSFFEELKAYLTFYDTLQARKNEMSIKEINLIHTAHMFKYLEFRNMLLTDFILVNEELFEEVRVFASKNVIFDTLVDGYSIDVNRNDPKNSKLLPILPFRHQLSYIHTLEYGTKGVIVEKGRRQGASMLASNDQRRSLIHKKNQTMAIANKSKLDTDRGKNDTQANSSMSRVDLMLENSIFVPSNYLDKIYANEDLIKAGKGSYRGYGPPLQVYKSNRLEGLVMGKGLGTGQGLKKLFLDEYDVFAEENPNVEKTLFGACQAASNRTILYSTYRSIEYSMYRTVKNKNTDIWDFERLHWANNPVCNIAWYINECGKLDDVESDIAREHDINPHASVAGRVFPAFTEERQITKQEAIEKFGIMDNAHGWTTIIAADNGGNKMSQNYNIIRIHELTSRIYIEDNMFIDADSEATDVIKWAWDNTPEGEELPEIYADKAIKDEFGFSNTSTKYQLIEAGFTVYEVSNRDLSVMHKNINRRFKDGEVFVNKDCSNLTTFLTLYRYKDDGTLNKKDSHVGDAICYGIKGFFGGSKACFLGN